MPGWQNLREEAKRSEECPAEVDLRGDLGEADRRRNVMRIAISATGTNLDADVDPRFGRCPYFIIVDLETERVEVVPNEYTVAGGGAGISTAQMVANAGVNVVLTGNVGPNAYQVLRAAGIQVVTGVSGKVKDALEAFKREEYRLASEPTVDTRSGMGFGPGTGRGMGRGMGLGRGRRRGQGS